MRTLCYSSFWEFAFLRQDLKNSDLTTDSGLANSKVMIISGVIVSGYIKSEIFLQIEQEHGSHILLEERFLQEMGIILESFPLGFV